MASIEFRPAGVFTSPLFSTQKSARRAVRDGVVTASVALFVAHRGFLFVGLTDGRILCWETDRLAAEKRKGAAPKVLDEHRGGVKCMIYVASLCSGVMFTGAADRCVKLWDLSDPRVSVPCVHSLHGHGGTVLALEFGSDMLLSTATDGFLCVWRDQSPVKLLRFPAYGIKQKLAPDRATLQGGQRAPKETWFLSVSIREGETPTIFAGDSDGCVHTFRPEVAAQGQEDRDQFFLLVSKVKVHELGISKLLCVPMESFLFTLSYDQKFKTLDSLSAQVVFEESNPCSVIFNGLAWDSPYQDVIVGDGRGNVGFYNLYTESCVAWRSLTKDAIMQVHYDSTTRRLLLLSPHQLRVFDVVRGVKFSELNEHTGPIVSMASRPTEQGGLLYTAAMDNSIRLWDTDTLECIKRLKEKKNEITAMVYLPRANVIVTGHENNDLKMWSLDSQQEALLRQVSGAPVHANTISALIWVASEDLGSFGAGPDPNGAGAGFELLVAGSYDRQLSFWRVTLTSDGAATAKFDRVYTAHDSCDDEILAVAHSPAAQSIFTGGNHGVIRKWAFWGARRLEREYDGHEDAVTCFAVDGHFLYSGSVDCTVRIWETSRHMAVKTVRNVHDVTVQALLIVPESGFVASCAFDGRVVFWDPQVSKRDGVGELRTYDQPEEFRSLAFLGVSRTILVGCESGKIIGFPLPEEDASLDRAPPPQMLSGVATPPSARDGAPDGRETLEHARHTALKAAELAEQQRREERERERLQEIFGTDATSTCKELGRTGSSRPTGARARSPSAR